MALARYYRGVIERAADVANDALCRGLPHLIGAVLRRAADSAEAVAPVSLPGVFKVVVSAADAKGRWKPEPAHEYFGIAVDAGYKAASIWAVKIK